MQKQKKNGWIMVLRTDTRTKMKRPMMVFYEDGKEKEWHWISKNHAKGDMQEAINLLEQKLKPALEKWERSEPNDENEEENDPFLDKFQKITWAAYNKILLNKNPDVQESMEESMEPNKYEAYDRIKGLLRNDPDEEFDISLWGIGRGEPWIDLYAKYPMLIQAMKEYQRGNYKKAETLTIQLRGVSYEDYLEKIKKSKKKVKK